jgi:hypothetical protein
MQIMITSTDKLTTMDGVLVRCWEGVTQDGVDCFVFVHRLAVKTEADTERFEKELREQLPPGRSISLRDIL